MNEIPEIIVGTWNYSSFINDPTLRNPFPAKIEINPGELQSLSGQLFWDDQAGHHELCLKGSIAYGNPFTVRFQGTGTVYGEEWVYDYVGYLVPDWGNGVDQRSTMVGSIVRTRPHGGSEAGVVGPWIATKE